MDKPSLISVVLSWIPMLMLLGAWIYFFRQFQGPSGMTQGKYLEEMLKEHRRHNEQLERLLASTNDRLTDLERRHAAVGR